MLSTSSSSSSSSSFYVGLFDYRSGREDVEFAWIVFLGKEDGSGTVRDRTHSTRRVDEVNGENNGAWC